MNFFLRRCKGFSGTLGALIVVGMMLMLVPRPSSAQIGNIVHMLHVPNPLKRPGPKVYLGVDLANVDAKEAQTLKLQKAGGVVVTVLDHDAPAAQAGIHVHDVILTLNDKNVKNVNQFWHMLHQYPVGRKVHMGISHNGDLRTLTVDLLSRRTVEREAWQRIGNGGDIFPSAPTMGMFSGAGNSPVTSGFHLPFFGSTLNVGALVEPLTSQMAEYLGIASGLMVKQVARKSEAALAGLHAFDVIVKIGSEKVTNVAAWNRALRANWGKPVQVTILRNRKLQVLTLQVASEHSQRGIRFGNRHHAPRTPVMASLNPAGSLLTR